jgi:hypothetical protein
MSSFKSALIAAAITLGSLAAAAPASALVLAASSFDAGDDGWTNGDFSAGGGGALATGGGIVAAADNYSYNAFIASTAYLGDKSAANGGALSFDVGDDTDYSPGDFNTHAMVTLFGAGTLIYGGLTLTPPANGGGFAHYDIALIASNFYAGDPNAPDLPASGVAVSELQFAQILGSLDRVAINGDFHDGSDYARLDNVVLSAGVPEPAPWGLMIVGFGAAGALLRRQRGDGGRAITVAA